VEGATEADFPDAGRVSAEDVFDNGRTLTVTIPDGLASGLVTVVTQGGTSAGVQIEYNADVTPPEVVEVFPAPGSLDVPVNTAVTIFFSEPMNPESLTTVTVVLTGPEGVVEATVEPALYATSVVLRPLVDLPTSTTFTLTVTDVEDMAGNALLSPFESTFTTGSQADVVRPQVVRASPVYVRNQTTGEYVSGSLSVDVTGRTAYFMPAGPFAVGTYHEIWVTTGIQDVAGNRLTSTFYQYFTTAFSADETPPEVELVDPATGAAAVPTNAQITVQMSEALDPISVTESAVLLEQGGAVVEGTLSLEDGNRRIRLVPTVPLAPLASHRLTVSELRDMAGNVMAASVEVNFTTAAGADLVSPQVVGTNPSSGATEVVRTVVVRVEFSEPVNPMTVNESSVQLRNLATSHTHFCFGPQRLSPAEGEQNGCRHCR
jgi:hypothetical protein